VQLGEWRELLDVDDAVGALWNAIQNTGQADRTHVIYTINNGWMNDEHRLDKKSFTYEESTRSWCVVLG
jgi:N-acetylglucosamine-6-sulfatase